VSEKSDVTLFLCGDVMTGRGIDQILPYPSHSEIHEDYITNAFGYVELAEEKNGAIARPVGWDYIWGDSIKDLSRIKPDARIINLETALTTSDAWCEKGINYRMHPRNIPCLQAAGIDVCSLANNHSLDWGRQGLLETLNTLKDANILPVGAGMNLQEASRPAIIECDSSCRVLVFAMGTPSSGIPLDWAASENSPGVHYLADLSRSSVESIAAHVRAVKRSKDIVVFSLHWGANWGYEISVVERQFAHALMDEAGVDVFHGHSSHHPKGFEVYHDKLILYGCGDLITDYEGISGYEDFRGDLAVMYFPKISVMTGELLGCEARVFKMLRFQLVYAEPDVVRWLERVLSREGRRLGTSTRAVKNSLCFEW
jgi:poly-gamma-glutamate synthesis protein (capsule biosynthesis protein)